MRGPSLFSRIITLALFISLLAGFVAYRSGLLAGSLSMSKAAESDSTKTKRDSTRLADSVRSQYNMRATSKSGAILIEDIDTIGSALREVLGRAVMDSIKPAIEFDPTIMSSSKSINPMIVIDKDSSK